MQNTESLQILFDCGVLFNGEYSIKIDEDEIVEYKFCNIDEALSLLGIPLRKRLRSYLSDKAPVYLENGLKI